MKNQFAKPFGENKFSIGNIEVSVLDLRASDQKEFVLFTPVNNQANLRLIAAPMPLRLNHGSRFGIRVKNKTAQRMAIAIYVNGKSIVDESELPRYNHSSYSAHGSKFVLSAYATEVKDHAIIGGETPALCFVAPEMGYAEASANYDPACANQIKVFAWVERPRSTSGGLTRGGGTTRGIGLESTKSFSPSIGLGDNTGHQYQSVATLHNPEFVGESIVVYLGEQSFASQGHNIFTVGRYDQIPVVSSGDFESLIPQGNNYPRVNG